MKTKACRYEGCRAEVIFAQTPAGKVMPIDAKPFARDDVARAGRWLLAHGPQGIRCYRGDEIDTAAQVYVAHFATCPGVVGAAELARRREREPALAARIDEYGAR